VLRNRHLRVAAKRLWQLKTTQQDMKRLYQIGLIAILCNFLTSCNGQSKESNKSTDKSQSVGGAFENSEFTYYGIPKIISSIDTSAGWNLNGQKILLTGTWSNQRIQAGLRRNFLNPLWMS